MCFQICKFYYNVCSECYKVNCFCPFCYTPTREGWQRNFQLFVSCVSSVIGAVSLQQDHRVLRCLSDRGLPGFMFCGVKFKKVVINGHKCEWMYPPGIDFTPPSIDTVDAGKLDEIDLKQRLAEQAPENKIILYIHGGAFVLCTPSTQRMMLAEMVKKTGLIVLAIDYPRPPEAPYPVPVDACESVYDWLTTSMAVPPSRLLVGGDSAGGCLTLTLAARLRDNKKPLPSQLLLLSPWVDLTQTSGASWDGFDQVDIIRNKPWAIKAASMYVGDAAVHETSPAHFKSLAGLPETLLIWGGSEMLCDQITKFGQQLVDSGVDVKQMCYSTMHHVVPLFADTGQAEPQDSLRAIRAFAAGEEYPYKIELWSPPDKNTADGTDVAAPNASLTRNAATVRDSAV